MLPGLDGTGELFSPLVKVLPEALTPIIIAYPKDRPLDYDGLEHYLVERIKSEEPFAILAESFSGPLALRLAAKSPPNLIAIILCATFIQNPLPKMSTLVLPAVIEKVIQLPLPKLLIRYLLLEKDAPEDMINTFRKILKTINPKVLATRIRSVLTVDAKQALLNCPQPILFLCATKDRIVPRSSLEYIKKLRLDTEIAWIDAPHLLLQCKPQLALEAIQVFLKRRNLCL